VSGTAIAVPLDANLRASGPPAAPHFYTANTIQALPIKALPNAAIVVAPGLPPGVALTIWNQDFAASTTVCTGTNAHTEHFPAHSRTIQVIYGSTADTLWLFYPAVGGHAAGSAVLSKQPGGAYYAKIDYAGSTAEDQISLQFTDATHITGTVITTSGFNGTNCTTTSPFTLTETSTPPITLTPSA
jgi:hypothetical protein